jgi:hypothetical protein
VPESKKPIPPIEGSERRRVLGLVLALVVVAAVLYLILR